MVLGKLPVPGRPTILITVGQGPITLYLFSLSLGGVLIKTGVLSQGPLHPKQPTNQPDQ